MTTGCGFGLTDDDDDAVGRHNKDRGNSMDVSAFQRILENMDDQDFKTLMGEVERARKRGKPGLKDGAELYARMADTAPRIPVGGTGQAEDTEPNVMRPGLKAGHELYERTKSGGGMNIPRNVHPERLAQLLRAAEPGDWFRIDGDQAQNIDLSK